MPKCLKCKGKIDGLNAYSLEENRQTVTLEGNGLDWGVSEAVEGTCQRIDFECPLCHATLFTNNGDSNDDRIIAFLKS